MVAVGVGYVVLATWFILFASRLHHDDQPRPGAAKDQRGS
jgi:hypothetical protein